MYNLHGEPGQPVTQPSSGYFVGEAHRQTAVTFSFIYSYTYALEISIMENLRNNNLSYASL